MAGIEYYHTQIPKTHDDLYHFIVSGDSVDTSYVNMFITFPKRLDNKVYRIMQCAMYHIAGAAKDVTLTWFVPDGSMGYQMYAASLASATTTLLTWSGEWKMPQEWYLRYSVTPGAAAKNCIFWITAEAVDA